MELDGIDLFAVASIIIPAQQPGAAGGAADRGGAGQVAARAVEGLS